LIFKKGFDFGDKDGMKKDVFLRMASNQQIKKIT
jgi:hypothetical protein